MKRKRLQSIVFLSVALVLALGIAWPGKSSATVPGNNEAVTVNTSGGSPNSNTSALSSSLDGRYVVFQSNATDLVSSPAVTGSNSQIYVRDRYTNTTQLVSVNSAGTNGGNSWSQAPTISSDGRYVAFNSPATNLTNTNPGGTIEVYVRDLVSQTTVLASSSSSGAAANSTSYDGSISGDGNFVVFRTAASNLVSGVTPSSEQVFVKDLTDSSVKVVSKNGSGALANANTTGPRISCEGRFIIFLTNATNLPGQTSAVWNIYMADMLHGGAVTDITPNVPSGTSFGPMTISCNGNYVGFNSDASNIVSGDTNSQVDAFIYDRITNGFDLVSKSSSGTLGNDTSAEVSVSNDGRFVTFSSAATNLIASDTNSNYDIFMHDRLSGTTELVSKNLSGTQANGFSFQPSISSNAKYIFYGSTANNLISGYSNSNGLGFSAETGINDGY